MLAARSHAVNLFLAGKILNAINMWAVHCTYMSLDPPLQPVVMTVPIVNLTINNYNLTMKCLPNNGNFHYKWIKKNSVLPLRTKGKHTSQMTIMNLRHRDSGEYQCVMSNSTGTISSNFTTVKIKSETDSKLVTSCSST